MANLPDPVTRKEQYLSVMAENSTQYPEEPITREEMYLDYLCKNGTGGGSGGTTNYNQLTNRPQINGNTLEGNLTAEDLGLQPENLVVTLTQNGESITADKSYADISQAYTDGKDIYAVIEGNIVPLYGKAGTTYIFQSVLGVQVTDFELNSEDTWSVETINIIANSTRPGGIIADEKTDDDTVEVHVDSKTGKAYVNASQDTTTTPPIINTVSGNPITLTDSSDNLLQGFEMDGKTEQVTTTGAQLLDLSNTADRTDTTYVLTDTGLTVTGLFYVSNLVDVNPNTDMYISYEKSGDGVNIVSVYNSSGLTSDDRIATYTTQGGTFNTGDNSQINVLFYSGQGTSSSSTYSNVMLNEGTGAKPYEPYTGGAPSPSPDYPQEIVSSGSWDETAQKWEYEINMAGAQLWDESNESSYAKGRRYVFHCEPNTDYTLSTDVTVNSLGVWSDGFSGENLHAVKYNATELTFNSGEYDTLYVQVYQPENSGGIKVMLNAGSAALPYEPYHTPQTVTLQSDRPLTKWDKLEKRNGQWGWVYKSEEKQVTQNDSATYLPEGYFNLDNFLQADINKLLETKCNYFIYNQDTSKDDVFWINSAGTGLRIKSSKFEDVDELKLWLSENDVRILYCKYTETFTPLTPEESAALDALVSYYPTTVISNQQGLNMTVDYIADTKTYIDNKFAELQHSIANTNAQLLGGN